MTIPRSKIVFKSNVIKSKDGFILITALIACLILMALGLLVFWSSNEDLRSSAVSLGEKRALAAAESGYHIITQTFNPLVTNYGIAIDTWTVVDATYDPHAQFRVSAVALSPFPALPPPGYSMESSAGWGMARYDVTVSGRNNDYHTEQQLGVGIAYGPVDLSLIYK